MVTRADRYVRESDTLASLLQSFHEVGMTSTSGQREPEMKMQVEPVASDVVKVILEGRLDITGAGVIDLQFNAIAGSHRGVIVDLSRVSFLASIGIRTLLLGAKAVQRRGGVFVLLNPVLEVAKVLDLMGAIELMPIYRDPEAALTAALVRA